MPLVHHDDVEQVAGDDWLIVGTLLDVNGNPLDITNITFEWTLIDPDGAVCPAVQASAIETQQPYDAGIVWITVPRQASEALVTGRYHDALRGIVTAADTSQISAMMWVGAILVAVDAFSVLPVTPPTDALSAAPLAAGAPVLAP